MIGSFTPRKLISWIETYSNSTYGSFYHTTTGATAIGAAVKKLVLGNTRASSGGVTVTDSVITVDTAGTYQIHGQASLNTANITRSEATVYFQTRRDGGSWLPIDGTESLCYLRGYDYGSTASITVITELIANEEIRLVAKETGAVTSAPYQQDNGTRVTLTKL